jgi:hypothetical protein
MGLALSAPAQSPGKVGVINIQGAIDHTQRGALSMSEVETLSLNEAGF